MRHIVLFCILILCFFTSCGKKDSQQQNFNQLQTYELKYAQGFKIDTCSSYTRVTVFNPWRSGTTLQTYYLVTDNMQEVPSDGQRLLVPLTSLAVTSCTHIGFLTALEALSTVSGVCNPELIYNASVEASYAAGHIVNLGDAFNVNLERLLYLKPNGVMITSYNQQDDNVKRLEGAGIPLIYNNEWTETSLLGRTEWIKFVAAFYNMLPQADSLFSEIESNYLEANRQGATLQKRIRILAGGNFKGTWYMPSGRSYMGQLFIDAGADYAYATDTTTGSLPLNFETVLHKFAQAPVWLNAPAKSMQELYELDPRHRLFKAAKENRVYSFYKRVNAKGTNDFWESGVMHPDLLLKDIIWAMSPESLPEYEPYFLIHLN